MKAIPLALLLLFHLLWLLPYLRIHNIKVTECLLVPRPITPQNYSGVNDPNPWREERESGPCRVYQHLDNATS
ncbi:hypothetical protein LX32DRAFT_157002 [Colletotrichum zoysiae]|uniref:Secreted protein n=1 Tax=Colletotrichum zoysiae TaxID=1216348 RepID=A0AAD9HQV1_9PEZI|nr:hypothetical protein LX32DRAFT_157002 [Colletotrichum zoysiae]